MGDVLVKEATLAEGRIEKLRVHLHNLPERVIDRETALAWMKDGHSLIPLVGGERQSALQLVEVGETPDLFIRVDNAPEPQDTLPELAPVR